MPDRAPDGVPRVLTVDRAAEFGFDRGDVRGLLRRGLWRRLRPGVLLARPETPRRSDWLRAAVATAGPTSAISGLDALRLAGLTSAREARLPPLVITRCGDVRGCPGVRVRTTRRDYRVWSFPVPDDLTHPLPVVPVARALADAASLAAAGWAVRAWATEAVQRGRCTADELAYEADAGPRRHSAALRGAIGDVRDGARSIAEARAAELLGAVALPPFELNVPVLVHGVLVAVVDVLFRDLRAVLEVDGRTYHDGERYERTLERHNELTGLGLAVRHCAPTALRPGWAESVGEWLRRRARELAVPYRPRRRALVAAGPDGPAALRFP